MDPSRSYRHFCAMARSLELIGERWSLLVVRDLLLGPRRFSDLVDSLGGITPTRLTERLRHLQAVGIVERDRRPGRREVWYRLTEAGQDLGPVVDALTLWGIRHARPAVRPHESVRAQHVLNGTKVWLDLRRIRPRKGTTWVWHLPDDEAHTLRYDGAAWQLTREDAQADADVVARTTPPAWARFLTAPPSQRRLPDLGIHLSGTRAAQAEFAASFGSSRRDLLQDPAVRDDDLLEDSSSGRGVPMTDASAETPFAQHARLAELVNGLRFRRYALFLAGLVYEHADGGLHRAVAVGDRDGDVLAWDAGEPFHLGGRVPASRLLDDDDLTSRSGGDLLRALADRNQEFVAHEVAALTEGRHSVNEVAIRILRQWLRPERPPAAVLRAEVLGVFPIEVTDALLDTFRELASRPDRGVLVEQALQAISP